MTEILVPVRSNPVRPVNGGYNEVNVLGKVRRRLKPVELEAFSVTKLGGRPVTPLTVDPSVRVVGPVLPIKFKLGIFGAENVVPALLNPIFSPVNSLGKVPVTPKILAVPVTPGAEAHTVNEVNEFEPVIVIVDPHLLFFTSGTAAVAFVKVVTALPLPQLMLAVAPVGPLISI